MVKFSLIISDYNAEKPLKECLGNLIDQTFKDIEIICINHALTDNSKNIPKAYENYEQVHFLENVETEEAIIKSIEISKGEYISFLKTNKLSKNALNSVYSFICENDMDLFSLPMIEREIDFETEKNQVIDLNKNPEKVSILQSCLFIRKDSISNLELAHNEDYLSFLNKVLNQKKKIGLINDGSHCLKSDEDKNYAKEKEFYINRLNSLKNIIDYNNENVGEIDDYTKYLLLYGLKIFEELSEFSADFKKEDIDFTFKQLTEILSQIDEDNINDPSVISNINFRRFLIYLKNHQDFHVKTNEKKSKIFLETGNFTINRLHNHNIYFDIVEIKEGYLNFSGSFTSSCDNNALSIEAIKTINGKKESYPGKFIEYPTTNRKTTKFLGIAWKFSYNFDIKIPIKDNEESKINFQVIYEENGLKITMKNKIKFRYHSNLSLMSNYFIKDSQIILFRGKTFNLLPYSYRKALNYELKSIVRIFKSKKDQYIKAIFYKILYIILLPIMKNKEIWIFQDRPTIADADGSYLFKYAIKQKNDNVSMYFVIDKESNDFEKMRKISKNIVDFNSFKHKILYIFAKKIICPWTNRDYVNPFYYNNFELYRGFLTPVYFIQHGIIMGDLSRRYNKARDNVSLFSTSSEFERDSIVNGNYNQSKDVVQVVGLPRYDSLENKGNNKQILFVPTWRRNMKEEDDLLNSNYYKRLDGFLNNEKLINFLKEKDYKIIFKPHPELLKYYHLFKVNNENVFIDTKESYQKLFNESSIMITDYSSVFFDFAYLKKPLIYYQYKGVHEEYTYEKGYFDFETMGFGDVIEEEEDLVEKIISYIKDDCKLEDKYKERSDKFFKFRDKNNCKRVYQWILNH